MPSAVTVFRAVEGNVDEAVFRRVVACVRALPGPVYGKTGKVDLRRRLSGFDQAAHHFPWLVLVDLNHDATCAPPLRIHWLPEPAPLMCFRVVVRAVEAWLMADREHLARFLALSVSRLPFDPEAINHPKQVLVDLARRSRKRETREDMVPRPGSRRSVGPAYTSRLIEFVEDIGSGWRPAVAAKNAPSLHRCLSRLQVLVGRLG